MALAPLTPCMTLTFAGDAERAKFGSGGTVRTTEVVFVSVPDVPVIVTAAEPAAAVLLTDRVSVLVAMAGFGLNDAVTPPGSPDADRLTLPLKPFCEAIVIVAVPLAPRTTVRLAGEADTVKPGIGPPVGQLFTRFIAFRVPIPVAKSQPIVE